MGEAGGAYVMSQRRLLSMERYGWSHPREDAGGGASQKQRTLGRKDSAGRQAHASSFEAMEWGSVWLKPGRWGQRVHGSES